MPMQPQQLLTGCIFQHPAPWIGRVKLLEVATKEQANLLQELPGVYYHSGGTKIAPDPGWYLPQSVLDMGRFPGMLYGYEVDGAATDPSGRELRDYQRRTVTFLRAVTPQREGAILAADMGLGKAQPYSCRVVTPNGHRRLEDLEVGDSVIGPDGLPTTVLEVIEQGIRDVYEITFSDGSRTRSDGAHLWTVQSAVQKKRGHGWRTVTLDEIKDKLHDAAGNRRYYIPMTEPVRYHAQEEPLPVDPYLLGLIIGDGGLTGGGISFSNSEEDILRSISDLLPADVELKPAGRECAWRLSVDRGQNNPLINILRDLELMGLYSVEKFIPEIYLRASVPERIKLLQGLIDTDGDVGGNGYTVIANTSSPQLAEGILDLVQSLGGVGRLASRIPKYTYKGEVKEGHRAFRISIRLPKGVRPVSSKKHLAKWVEGTKYEPTRGIEHVNYIGQEQCRCIRVSHPSGLYLTDDFVVTHNCSMTLQAFQLDGYLSGPGIICGPLSAQDAWVGEGSDATDHFGLDVFPLSGRKEPDTSVLSQHKHFFIHYDILEAWRIWLCKLVEPKFVIFDESHLLIYQTTGRSEAAYNLSLWHSIDRRYLLTGTPIPNRRLDLWHQLAIAQPRQWSTHRHIFGMRYAGGRRAEESEGGHFIYDGETHTQELQQRLAGTFLRYTRFDVPGEMPELKRRVIPVEPQMHKPAVAELMEEYHRVATDTINYLVEKGDLELGPTTAEWEGEEIKISAAENKPQAIRLRAISKMIGILSEVKSEEALRGVYALMQDHNLIVFFTWRRKSAARIADAVRTDLRKNKSIANKQPEIYGPIDGSMKKKERRKLAREFAKQECAIFVATLGAAGISIDELAAASAVCFVDLHWNPAVLTQAESRVQRLSSPHETVESHYLVVKNTIDELFIEKLVEKSAAAAAVSPNDQIGMNLVADLSATNATSNDAKSLDEICALLAQRKDLC